jgi:hypothetical protein
MRILGVSRYALSCSLAAAMLAGCGGRAGDGVMPLTAGPVAPAYHKFPYHKTFNYAGRAQDFKVPAGVRRLQVVALGAHGAGIPQIRGGRVSAMIPVTPGEVLEVYVGGNASGVTGGFNGGADGGKGYEGGRPGYGSGGASDIRQHGDSLGDRILVSGGGGGQGGGQGRYTKGGVGGKGGGLTGGTGGTGGSNYSSTGSYGGGGGGAGGTQYDGGPGGVGSDCYGSYPSGAKGTLGAGGVGGLGGGYYDNPGGGGGGGGYYGGGGGGGGSSYGSRCVGAGGGGGGGSSYVERRASDVHMWQAWKESAGNGLVVLSWN